LARIDWQRLADIPLVLDLVDEARPHLIAIPRKAKQRFVEMGVSLHQLTARYVATIRTVRRSSRAVMQYAHPKSEYPRVAAKRANVLNKKISCHHPFPSARISQSA
jgi:hypothetical protein